MNKAGKAATPDQRSTGQCRTAEQATPTLHTSVREHLDEPPGGGDNGGSSCVSAQLKAEPLLIERQFLCAGAFQRNVPVTRTQTPGTA
jgi:hypothetical protein